MARKSTSSRTKKSSSPTKKPVEKAAKKPRKGKPSAKLIVPELAANAERLTAARLREFGEKVTLRRDPTLKQNTALAGFGTTVRGLNGAPPCAHYLPENRLDWWDWYHDHGVGQDEIPHGPLAPEAGETQDEAVNAMFCSTLATLVGTNLNEIMGVLAHIISWDDLPGGASPNDAVGIEYAVRTVEEGCVPDIRELPLGGLTSKVLVDCPADERPRPDEPPPPLVFDFAVPQRAVVLEYGWWSDLDPAEVEIYASRVILIGYDRNGDEITRSDGSFWYGDNDFILRPKANTQLIGVGDRNGDICAVELQFIQYTDDKLLDPLFVRRLWHEPFPPAAVKQGTLEAVWYGLGDERNTLARTDTRLPFHCDNFIVLNRGFRFEFLGDGHEVTGLSFMARERQDILYYPGQKEVHLEGFGSAAVKDAEEAYPYRVKIYYTVVAWDSALMDVQTTRDLTIEGQLDEAESVGRIITNDPCQPSREWEAPGTSVCGDVFGALKSLRCYTNENERLERLFFQCSELFRVRYMPPSARVGIGEQWPPEEGMNVSDSQSQPYQHDTSLSWGMWCHVHGEDDGPNWWEMRGRMMTGFSVIVPQTGPYAFSIPRGIKREDIEFHLSPEAVTQAGWDVHMDADMAFVGLEMFQLEDLEELRAIDFEVKGHHFNGGRLSWKIGYEGTGGEAGSDDCFHVVASPCFGGLVSRRRKPRYSLYTRDVHFEDGTVDVLSLEPAQYGFIKNQSNLPIMITGGEIKGTDARNFFVQLMIVPDSYDIGRMSHRLLQANEAVSLADLPRRGPVWVPPNDYLSIGGSFLPDREGTFQAWIELRTNTPQSPVPVRLSGETIPSQAIGNWFPPRYDMGKVTLGTSYSRNALITSDGPTPLLVTSLKLEFEPRNLLAHSFSFSGLSIIEGVNRKQVQPGHSLALTITFSPQMPGRASATLVAETNAGTLRMPLRAEGVRR